MEDLTAGSYPAQVKEWFFRETKNQKMELNVVFNVCGTHSYTWRAYPEATNEKAREILVKSLRTMGFQGSDLSDLATNTVDALDKSKDLTVALDYEENPENGKVYPRIKWVNEVTRMESNDALSRLKSLDLKADFMAVKPSVRTEAKTADDLPF